MSPPPSIQYNTVGKYPNAIRVYIWTDQLLCLEEDGIEQVVDPWLPAVQHVRGLLQHIQHYDESYGMSIKSYPEVSKFWSRLLYC